MEFEQVVKTRREIVSVIAVAYPDIEPEMPKRKTPENIVKFY